MECWDSSQPFGWGDLSPTETVIVPIRFPMRQTGVVE